MFHLLIQFSNGCNSQSWARPNLSTRTHFQFFLAILGCLLRLLVGRWFAKVVYLGVELGAVPRDLDHHLLLSSRSVGSCIPRGVARTWTGTDVGFCDCRLLLSLLYPLPMNVIGDFLIQVNNSNTQIDYNLLKMVMFTNSLILCMVDGKDDLSGLGKPLKNMLPTSMHILYLEKIKQTKIKELIQRRKKKVCGKITIIIVTCVT